MKLSLLQLCIKILMNKRGISAFTLQNVAPQIERQEKCINKNVTSFNSSTKKMNESVFLEIT